ncbi:hypothetical protein CU669_15170 [Paramagnetospirillum kuznetsovii]|uniref:ParB/Sulfiredoxin domain-containing protein n=1 Tax=Paramagnetospirillum kuznetsovii TaxID=2053833 RepID=A0A364NVL3_9PROT|nr:hypothetical protein [Paramagnetospirillum kuznetsovii]RAU21093.1 hypothetical protein CU669_15170 [Paramagnetospirillum kuznetsovii]
MYKPHPYAQIFPLMSKEDFSRLVDDIRANGLRDPITVTSDGFILDGLNRYAACTNSTVEPRFEIYDGQQDGMLAFVLSKNLARRHLTESQRAAVAAKLANLEHGDNQHTKEEPQICGTSQADAAAMLNVSERSVNAAKKVQKADPALFAKVESGDIAVSRAEKMVRVHNIIEEKAPLDEDDVNTIQFNALMNAWNKAGIEARRRFMDAIDTPVFDKTRAAS